MPRSIPFELQQMGRVASRVLAARPLVTGECQYDENHSAGSSGSM
jgi:hypothetical protein